MSVPGRRGEGSSYVCTVAALALGQLICWAALYYGFSSFVLPMQRELGWTQSETMGAFTAGLATWGAGSYLAGAAIDRGLGRAVLCLGALLAGGGFVIWSQAHSLAVLYLTWVLLGAAMAMTLYEPAFNVLTKRYPDRYVRAITALALVGGFASTLSFPASTWLTDLFGWRRALAVVGIVLVVVVAPLHWWVLRGTPGGKQAAKPALDGDATLQDALRERSFWFLTASMTFHTFAAAALWAHIMPALASKGYSHAQALAVVVWLGPAQVVGRLLHFAVSRALGPWPLGVIVMCGLPLAMTLFALGQSKTALLGFALLFGLANGLVTIVRGSIVPEYFGRAHVGKISGAMTAIALATRASAPFATALLLTRLPGYRDLLLILSAVGVASLVTFSLAKRPSPSKWGGAPSTQSQSTTPGF